MTLCPEGLGASLFQGLFGCLVLLSVLDVTMLWDLNMNACMPGMGMRDAIVLALSGFCLSFIHAVGYLGFDRSLSLALPVT